MYQFFFFFFFEGFLWIGSEVLGINYEKLKVLFFVIFFPFVIELNFKF